MTRISWMTFYLGAALFTSCASKEKTSLSPAAENQDSAKTAKNETLKGMPPFKDLPNFTPQKVQMGELNNGAKIWLVEDNKLPLVTIRLALPSGSAADPKGKEGLNSLMMSMLNQGAGTKSTMEMSQAFRDIAASYGSRSTKSANLSMMKIHKDVLDQGLELMSMAILQPSFGQADWKREQKSTVNWLKQSRERESTVARELATLNFYGEGHPLSIPTSGTPVSTENLKLEELKTNHKNTVVPNGATFILVGDLNMKEAKELLEKHFGQWQGQIEKKVEIEVAPVINKTRFLIADSPGAAQTYIYGISHGYNVSDSDRMAADFVAIVMGGSFTSRLNLLLREKKGYTYGARASFGAGIRHTGFVTSTSVRTDVTGPALKDLIETLKTAKTGFNETDLKKARAQYFNDILNSAGGLQQISSGLKTMLAEGIDPNLMGQKLEKMNKITVDEMNKAAKKYINTDKFLFVLVGDRSKIEKPLKDLGFELEVADLRP